MTDQTPTRDNVLRAMDGLAPEDLFRAFVRTAPTGLVVDTADAKRAAYEEHADEPGEYGPSITSKDQAVEFLSASVEAGELADEIKRTVDPEVGALLVEDALGEEEAEMALLPGNAAKP